MDRTVRRSARVVVVDDEGCVLLVRVLDERDDKPPFWITPGGAVETDESLAEAAARELHEETGYALAPGRLTEPVAVARGDWVYRGTSLFSEDWYFGCRTARFAPDRHGYTALEREVLGTWRWWTRTELEATEEIVLPRGLLTVVDLIFESVAPGDGPITLPWTTL
jgi:8-oxo-dGTP pyrophosphatase MutT (NUDIX family)